MMNNKFLYIYYFALILVLILYTNTNGSPNIVVRFGYLAAMVIPLINKVEWFPAIIICALGISKSTFAYPFMPTDMIFYVVFALSFAFLALYRRDLVLGVNPLFYLIFAYVALNDIVMQEELSQMSIVFFIYLLFFICVREDLDIANHLLPFSFILISLAISYWILFCPEAQTNSYNRVGDMEQKGWSDPNYLGAVLGMGLVISIRDLFVGKRTKIHIALLVLTAIASTFAMLLLASRGALLSVVLSITSLFVLSKPKSWSKIAVIIAAALFIVFLYTNQYMNFVMARIEAEDGTGSHRTEIWLSKINDFFQIDNPLYWIFGVGQMEGARLGRILGTTVTVLSTHSDYVSLLIYYGFVGVLIFFSLVAYLVRICHKTDRPQVIALLVYLLVGCVTIEPLAQGNFVYWGFLFYIIIFARQSQELELFEEEEDMEYEYEEQE